MSSEPFLQAYFHVAKYGGSDIKKIPLDFVSLLHPSIQAGMDYNYGYISWPALYGQLRACNVERVLSSESIPLYVVICYAGYDDECYLMELDEWSKMGDYLEPAEPKADWIKEGF